MHESKGSKGMPPWKSFVTMTSRLARMHGSSYSKAI